MPPSLAQSMAESGQAVVAQQDHANNILTDMLTEMKEMNSSLKIMANVSRATGT